VRWIEGAGFSWYFSTDFRCFTQRAWWPAQFTQAASASKGGRPPRPPDGDRLHALFAQIQIFRRLHSATIPGRTALMDAECKVAIKSEHDIVVARQKGRAMARDFGFSISDATLIATAISELARNIIAYASARVSSLSPPTRAPALPTFRSRCAMVSPLQAAWELVYPACAA